MKNQLLYSENQTASRYDLLAKAFVNTNALTKKEFIIQAFDIAFELILEAEKGSYYELKGDYYEPVYSKGYDCDALRCLSFHKDDAFAEYVSPEHQEIESYEVVIKERNLELFTDEMIEAMKVLGTLSNFISLYAPIRVNNTKIGILCFDNFHNINYSEESKTMLKIYAQMFSNFYEVRLSQERLENRIQEIISTLVSAIELKDVYTKGHASRVLEFSLDLGLAYGLSFKKLRKLETAAILHDVGKIGVPTGILIKPNSLTDEEYEEVKKHPEHARKLLSEIEGFEEITELAYCHHEHYDGGGYPRGLKEEEIPIEAQIIQICDAFDAMTSVRAYRSAMSKETAIKILEKEKGKQFHPKLVELMIQIHK
ncbi:MAG: HD-GYP domain-containing protein [Clostridiales bacterium]|nr:HD-GYP domain-containing protein [Clostridiales bacterium]